MKHNERERLVHIISSGIISFKIEDQKFYIGLAPAEHRIEALEIYSRTYTEAELEGSMTFEESVDELFEKDLWTEEDEAELEELPEKIENLKLALYESFFKEKMKAIIKKNLRKENKTLNDLFKKKNALINYTCEGISESAKIEYLVYSSMMDSNKNYLIEEEPYETQDSNFIIQAVQEYHKQNVLDESSYRELARNEPWKAIWGASKTGLPLFNSSAADLTDSQKVLINWSRLYDNIYESTECPPSAVIEDDDALDGWLIAQHRKREKEIATNDVEGKLSDKTRNADEIFVPVDGDSEAERIHKMNNPLARRQSRQRFRKVEEEGEVSIEKFSDVKQKIQMQAIRESKQ